MDNTIIERLDTLIAATKAASVPLPARWLDAEGVGALLSFSPRYVLERIASRADFPKPLRIDGAGHPRWPATEVIEWAERHRSEYGEQR